MVPKFALLAVAMTLAMSAGNRVDAAIVYNVTDGFTGNSSTFTYGSYAGGSLAGVFNAFTESGNIGDYTGQSKYAPLLYQKDAGGIDPNVIYNSSKSTITTAPDYGDITFNAHELTFGPFNGPTVARFTAAFSGTYTISALFTGVQEGNLTPEDHVYVNGVETAIPTGTAFVLNQNDHVDFVVYSGPNNDHNKTTQVDVTISAVPEPATMAMCGMAVLMITGVAARRRLKNESAQV